MLAIASLVAGAALVSVGAGIVFFPAGLIVAGICLALAGWDLSRPDVGTGSDA